MTEPICQNCQHPASAHVADLFSTRCTHQEWWEPRCTCDALVTEEQPCEP